VSCPRITYLPQSSRSHYHIEVHIILIRVYRYIHWSPDCNCHVYVCINVNHIKMTCRVQDPCPYLQGQGQTYSLKVLIFSRRVWRYTFIFGLSLCHAWKDFKITWHKCLQHQASATAKALVRLSVCPHLHNNDVQTVTLSCIEGLWNNMAQMSIS
jgi:hypothetical protein